MQSAHTLALIDTLGSSFLSPFEYEKKGIIRVTEFALALLNASTKEDLDESSFGRLPMLCTR